MLKMSICLQVIKIHDSYENHRTSRIRDAWNGPEQARVRVRPPGGIIAIYFPKKLQKHWCFYFGYIVHCNNFHVLFTLQGYNLKGCKGYAPRTIEKGLKLYKTSLGDNEMLSGRNEHIYYYVIHKALKTSGALYPSLWLII